MRFLHRFAAERLQTEVRSCLALWPLGLIAVLIVILLWSSADPATAHAFQSPHSPLASPTATPTIVPPAQEPVPPNPAARLLLWVGIGLLMVAAIVGVTLFVQRRQR
jgi:hypothetical protein